MSRKVVKPTGAEKLEINRRLEKKYPGRKYKIKGKFMSGLKKKLKSMFSSGSKDTVRTKTISKQLSSNLSKDEIKRLRGK